MTQIQFQPRTDLPRHPAPGRAPAAAFVDIADADAYCATRPVLGRIDYGDTATGASLTGGHPRLGLGMGTGTADLPAFSEVWTTEGPVETGSTDGIVWSRDDEFLLCAGHIPEADSYAEATRSAYTTAIDLMHELGHTRCFRMWNFVNRINEDNADGLEVYRDFCLGRAHAFRRNGFADTEVPAATGIGARGDGIMFYLLASRNGHGTPAENPQQVAAYRYPKRYGPEAPRFARATRLVLDGPGPVYVSGTASITGHLTRFHGDVERQTGLALENIARVLAASGPAAGAVPDLYDLDLVKVYVRHADDLPTVRAIVEATLSPHAEVRYLVVDVCRADLLVEIEGIARTVAGPRP